jgi:hypothetical protein
MTGPQRQKKVMTFPVTGTPDQCAIVLVSGSVIGSCPAPPVPGMLFRSGCMAERHIHDEHMCARHVAALERGEESLFCVLCRDDTKEIVAVGLLQKVEVP